MRGVRTVGTGLFLVVLVAGAAALVVAAVRHTHGHTSSADARHFARLAEATAAAGDVAETPAPTTTAPPASAAPAATWLVSATGPGAAWRARAGCTAAPDLQTSTDGGTTWVSHTAPTPHLLRVVATGSRSAWVVGADAHCRPVFYSTSDAGTTWSAGSLSGVWVPDGSRVRTPTGTTTSPCGHRSHDAVTLAPSGPKDALALCTDAVLRTSSGGRIWSHAGKLPAGQPVTAAIGGSQGVLLLGGTASCDGLRVELTTDVGATWQSGRCLSGLRSPAGLTLASQGYGLLTSGKTTRTSTDAGRTWQ